MEGRESEPKRYQTHRCVHTQKQPHRFRNQFSTVQTEETRMGETGKRITTCTQQDGERLETIRQTVMR